jgi:hypothetical protein
MLDLAAKSLEEGDWSLVAGLSSLHFACSTTPADLYFRHERHRPRLARIFFD